MLWSVNLVKDVHIGEMTNSLQKCQLPIIPVDLELLGSVHSLQGAKTLNKEHEYLQKFSD